MDKNSLITRAKRRVEKNEYSLNARAKRRVEKNECSLNARAKRRVEKRFISLITQAIEGNIEVKKKLLGSKKILETIEKITDIMTAAFMSDKKVLFCGNGGSAADAQHLSAELAGKFYLDREPLPAEALHVNTSYLTAVANDYSFNEVFARLVKGTGKKGDILVGISTSGNSANVIRAIEEAKKKGMLVVGFTGETGGKMKEICDYLIKVPSTDTPRIQEAHILVGHIICELVEKEIFGKPLRITNQN